MNSIVVQIILNITDSNKIINYESIQELWSGYGQIIRVELDSENYKSVIIKKISFPSKKNHPRGWNTNASHERKIKSYKVEFEWYKNWQYKCNNRCKIPNFIHSFTDDDAHYLVLEDLNSSGFTKRKHSLNLSEVKLCLNWLANFHSTFINLKSDKLWNIGTYWHFKTRPDEFEKMNDTKLKRSASKIDSILNSCKYKTIVHGDAKVANFCFSEDMKNVSAVDFQYVGEGCGMKDVAYLFSSCLKSEECELYENELLNFYFLRLKETLASKNCILDLNELEKEWRFLYPLAWADFIRFLNGWMPTHQKINIYSQKKVEDTLQLLNNIA